MFKLEKSWTGKTETVAGSRLPTVCGRSDEIELRMANENRIDPETQPLEFDGLHGRTTARNDHPGRQCRRCGEPIGGRRRNGYCSDACRMRDRRRRQTARLEHLLDTISTALKELRREVLR